MPQYEFLYSRLLINNIKLNQYPKEGTHIVETVTIVVSDLLPEIELLLL